MLPDGLPPGVLRLAPQALLRQRGMKDIAKQSLTPDASNRRSAARAAYEALQSVRAVERGIDSLRTYTRR